MNKKGIIILLLIALILASGCIQQPETGKIGDSEENGGQGQGQEEDPALIESIRAANIDSHAIFTEFVEIVILDSEEAIAAEEISGCEKTFFEETKKDFEFLQQWEAEVFSKNQTVQGLEGVREIGDKILGAQLISGAAVAINSVAFEDASLLAEENCSEGLVLLKKGVVEENFYDPPCIMEVETETVLEEELKQRGLTQCRALWAEFAQFITQP